MKSTKKSLLLSTISLVLCFAMLLGTTWAWFTDEVTSGRNTIKAGNLDVELLHQGKNDTEATDVSDETELFDDITLWEPGAYVYETFTVKNVGNLALKYSMALNVASYTSYEGHNLTEVLKVKVVDTAPTSRPSYTDGVALEAWSLDSANQPLYPVGNVPGNGASEKTFTVVIYWEPTDNDNLYNMNNGRPQPLSVDLGVQLVATQLEYENDSFDNTYDHDADNTLDPATKIETAMASAVVVANQPTVFTTKNTPSGESGKITTVTVPAGEASFVADFTSTLKVETTPTVAANNKFTVGNGTDGAVGAIDLEVEVDGEVVSQFKDNLAAPVTVKVETYVAKNMTNVTLAYNGTGDQPTLVSYDQTTGKLVFTTTHFSTFVLGASEVAYVESNNTAYLNLEDAITAAQANDTVALLKNVSQVEMLSLTKSLTINGNKHAITSTQDTSTFSIDVANLSISMADLRITGTGDGNKSSAVMIAAQGANLNIESCDFSKNMYLIDVKNYGNPGYNAVIGAESFDTENPFKYNKDTTALAADATCNLTIKDSKLSGYGCINWKYVGGTCQVENCTFFDGTESDWAAIIIEGNGVDITVTNSKFNLTETLNSAIFQCGAKNCTLNLINCTASGNGVTTLDQMKTFVEGYNGGVFNEGDYYYSEKAGGVIMDNSGDGWSISTGNRLIVNGETILQPVLN